MLSCFPVLEALHADLIRLDVLTTFQSHGMSVAEDASRDNSTITVPWAGQFRLTEAQRRVVQLLMDAFLYHPQVDLAEEVLLKESQSDATSLQSLFFNTQAMDRLILRGKLPNSYRIAEPD